MASDDDERRQYGDGEEESLFDGAIVRRAAVDSLKKLNPALMAKNPVMFVVEVGSVVTTVLLFDCAAAALSGSTCRSRCGCGSRCCLRTSRRRWRRGAARRRPMRCARRSARRRRYKLKPNGEIEEVPSSHLRVGDKVRVVAGHDDSRRRRGD